MSVGRNQTERSVETSGETGLLVTARAGLHKDSEASGAGEGLRATSSQRPLIPLGPKGHKREWILEPRET